MDYTSSFPLGSMQTEPWLPSKRAHAIHSEHKRPVTVTALKPVWTPAGALLLHSRNHVGPDDGEDGLHRAADGSAQQAQRQVSCLGLLLSPDARRLDGRQ